MRGIPTLIKHRQLLICRCTGTCQFACSLPSFRGIYVWCITTIFRQPTFLDGIPADALAPYANITKLHQKFSCNRHLYFGLRIHGKDVQGGAAANSPEGGSPTSRLSRRITRRWRAEAWLMADLRWKRRSLDVSACFASLR